VGSPHYTIAKKFQASEKSNDLRGRPNFVLRVLLLAFDLGEQAFFLGAEFWRESLAKIGGIENGADFDVALFEHRIRAALDPGDRRDVRPW